MVSWDYSQCPLSTPIACLYIMIISVLLDALEGNNKEFLFKEEFHPGLLSSNPRNSLISTIEQCYATLL
jgi:hypothetical protein